MTAFTSWDGIEDLESFVGLKALEEFFGPHAVVVNTKQMAVQICLEIMGTKNHMIPVVAPVTTSIEVLTAVMDSGALPVILDIDTSTLQVKLDDLRELLQEGPGAVVILDRVGAYPVDQHVLEAVLDVPTIAVLRSPPHDCTDQLDLEATFTVYDLSEVIGEGAVIFHSNLDLIKELKALRGGPLGHKAWLTDDLCFNALYRLEYELDEREQVYHSVWQAFEWELNESDRADILLWDSADLIGPIYFQVPDAARMVEHLRSHGIPCRRAFFPLHMVPEIARRMPRSKEADYSGAEMLFKHTIMLPSHSGIEPLVPTIVEKMCNYDR